MIKNHLKILVLKILSEKKLSGYDLIKEIHNSTGHWKPSYGSIYPLLKELHSNKLVALKTLGRKKIYYITPYGRKTLSSILKSKEQVMSIMLREYEMMESIFSEKERKYLPAMLYKAQNDILPFGELNEQIDLLQRVMLELVLSNKIEQRKEDIKKVLNEAVEKLELINKMNMGKITGRATRKPA